MVEATASVLWLAMDLACRHALRGADAVHLAAGLKTKRLRDELGLSRMVWVGSDQDLNQAARELEFEILDPEEQGSAP
ncbi:MAG: hypothetical protein ACK44W_02500 [Planctomycetota bacterium]